MFKRASTVAVLLSLLFTINLSGRAQTDSSPITYGAMVTGEVTDAALITNYVFTGKKDDFIAIQMVAPAFKFNPSLSLLDKTGTRLTFADNGSPVTLLFVLPEDGDYTIQATRRQNTAKTGGYILSLDKVERLKLNDTVKGKVNVDAKMRRYGVIYVVSETDPFAAYYKRTSGNGYVKLIVAEFHNQPPVTVFGETLGLIGGAFTGGHVEVTPRKALTIIALENQHYVKELTEIEYSLTLSPIE
jgi:hypothetical protein